MVEEVAVVVGEEEEGVVATTIEGEEEEMEEGDVEEVGMVNLEVSPHPRAVRKYTLVHNWTRISLRTSDTPGSTLPSTRTFQ